MAYYPNKINSNITGYNNECVAFDIGKETRDNYSILTYYRHNVETDVITYESTVMKNWAHNEAPKDIIKIVEGKKYRQTLITGTPKECFKYIDDIVQSQGYWNKLNN